MFFSRVVLDSQRGDKHNPKAHAPTRAQTYSPSKRATALEPRQSGMTTPGSRNQVSPAKHQGIPRGPPEWAELAFGTKTFYCLNKVCWCGNFVVVVLGSKPLFGKGSAPSRPIHVTIAQVNGFLSSKKPQCFPWEYFWAKNWKRDKMVQSTPFPFP